MHTRRAFHKADACDEKFFFLSLSTSENSLHFNFSSLVTKRIFFWLERGRRNFLISILVLTDASRSISTCLYLFSHFSFLEFWRQRTIFGANACAKKKFSFLEKGICSKFLFPETRTFFLCTHFGDGSLTWYKMYIRRNRDDAQKKKLFITRIGLSIINYQSLLGQWTTSIRSRE